MINLFEHQKKALNATEQFNKCAYYMDMGLGKTFVGSEKLWELNEIVNIVVCQKSKIEDWIEHFEKNYSDDYKIFDLTSQKQLHNFISYQSEKIGIINYELLWRRSEILELHIGTLMLDESSLIQNEKSNRAKAILKMQVGNVVLLSGTPTGGKYEKLWSQLHLLGWEIKKTQFMNTFVKTHLMSIGNFHIPVVVGYKNVERLKSRMREYGCFFMKSDEAFELPEQVFTDINVKNSSLYKTLSKTGVVEISKNNVLVADNSLKKLLYSRQLCGAYSSEKLKAFSDLVESTDDRLIVFYNFDDELQALKKICNSAKKPISEVNGHVKSLAEYAKSDNSVTLVQYQSGAMGLNLQLSNKIVFFSPPLSSEFFEQSKKRIHRIGQKKTCFYYRMICAGTVEKDIYSTLEMRKDYTEKLFEKREN